MTEVGTPDVSVVIPTCRRPGPLREAVESALAQQGVTIEVLVLDDAPSESSRAALSSVVDSRLTYRTRAQPSGGRPALVRNEGLEEARGRYVHFLDDDDRLAPGALLTLVKELEEHPELGGAWGRVSPFGEDAHVLAQQRAYFEKATQKNRQVGRPAALQRWRVVASLLFRPTTLVNSSCLVRRECARALGGYDPEIPVCEDADFILRLVRRFGGSFVDALVLEYRTGAPSLMHDLEGHEKLRESYRLIHRNYRAQYGRGEFLALKALSHLWP